MGVRVDGDDSGATATNDETTSPGSIVTYFVIIDNDSSQKVSVTSLIDSKVPDGGIINTCKTAGGASTVVGIELDPDDGDGSGDVDPDGLDAVSCTYEVRAPESAGTEVKNVVTATVQSADGQTGTDLDDNTRFITNP
jgi:hypothetical protein